MNGITVRQNEQNQLERLAAQRELYSSAKRYQAWQIVLNVFIPVILSLLAINFEDVAPFAALFGTVITVLDVTLVDQIIKKKREKAAKIQELFDRDVLQLIPSPLKTSDDITVEEVLIHYKAHSKIQSNIEKIRDWYPLAVEVLPLPIGRLNMPAYKLLVGFASQITLFIFS